MTRVPPVSKVKVNERQAGQGTVPRLGSRTLTAQETPFFLAGILPPLTSVNFSRCSISSFPTSPLWGNFCLITLITHIYPRYSTNVVLLQLFVSFLCGNNSMSSPFHLERKLCDSCSWPSTGPILSKYGVGDSM